QSQSNLHGQSHAKRLSDSGHIAQSARSGISRNDLLQEIRRHPRFSAPSNGADGRTRRIDLALRRADAALSAVRNEDEQAAEQTIRIARVLLLQGSCVAIRCDSQED